MNRRWMLSMLALAAACEPSDEPVRAGPVGIHRDSAALIEPPAAPATAIRGLVVAYERQGEWLLMQPIAIAGEDGSLSEAPDDPASEEARAFIAEHFAPGRSYVALRGGISLGSLEVDSASTSSCTGLGAFGTLKAERGLPDEMSGVAIAHLARGAMPGGEPTEAETANAQTAAIELLRQAGVPGERVSKPYWQPPRLVVDHGGNRSVVVAAHFPTADRSEMGPTVFAVVDSAASAPRVSLHVTETGERGGPQSKLIDALDIDGDGTAELIVQNIRRYSWNYTIHERAGDAWTTIFDGSARGC